MLAAYSTAFGALVAVTPATAEGEPEPARVALADTRPTPMLSMVERESAFARASRTRVAAEAEAAARAAEAAAAAKAAAEAQAAAEAAAKAEAERAAAEAERAAAEQAAAAAAAAARKAMACPVPNASFTDTWGAPRSGGRAHKGTDLLAPYGSPAYAVVSGRIRTASSSLGGISLYLHGDNGETYFYAHNSANVAKSGQRVAAGDLIAKVGSTGNAGGTNHVHFERQVGGRSVNPYDFLRRVC